MNQKFTVIENLSKSTITLDGLSNLVTKPVYCTVPATLEERSHGLVNRIYIGSVSSHHEGGFCIQPKNGDCFVIEAGMYLEILPGKLADYS